MNRRIPAALAALMLGAGFAGACGSENGTREQVDQSNDGEQLPEGSNTQVETDPGPTVAPTETDPAVQGNTSTTESEPSEDGG